MGTFLYLCCSFILQPNNTTMRWQGRRESENVEDRRGMSTGGKVLAGGGMLGVIVIVLQLLLGGGGEGGNIQLPTMPEQNTQPASQLSPEEEAADNERASFVKVVLADTEEV